MSTARESRASRAAGAAPREPEARHAWVILLVAAIVLIATRAPHLSGPIDDPHSWRQCDTANYAWAFLHDGVDLLRPSVCWMGPYKTLVLEFPLPEFLMAIAYRVLGYDLIWARLVTLMFFAGSAVYLFLLARRIWNGRIGAWTAAVYVALPLSQFYSRALHIDFAAMCFAHAMAYHLIVGYQKNSWTQLATGALAACFAALIKAPYALVLGIPAAAVMLAAFDFRRLMRASALMIIPLLVFFVWQHHVDRVNAAAPDWSFIPGYLKFAQLSRWYYGPLDLRFDPHAWSTLATRLLHEVLTRSGALLALGGLAAFIVRRELRDRQAAWFLTAWIAAATLDLLIFFNLNLQHDYYQIPFLAPSAILIALALDMVARAAWPRSRGACLAIAGGIYALLALEATAFAESAYYHVDFIREGAGAIIAAHTPANSVVIVSEPGTDCRDPRLLFRAHRNGWSINAGELTPTLVAALAARGADELAIVVPAAFASGPPEWIDARSVESFAIGDGTWHVMLAPIPRPRGSVMNAK